MVLWLIRFCTYLAHHDPESVKIADSIIIVITTNLTTDVGCAAASVKTGTVCTVDAKWQRMQMAAPLGAMISLLVSSRNTSQCCALSLHAQQDLCGQCYLDLALGTCGLC